MFRKLVPLVAAVVGFGVVESVSLSKDVEQSGHDGKGKGKANKRWQALEWDDKRIMGRQYLEQYTDPEFDGVKVNHKCRNMYNKAMKELYLEAQAGGSGSTLVLGANDGRSYDPATEMFDFWHMVPQMRKVFVEPVPPLFEKLQ